MESLASLGLSIARRTRGELQGLSERAGAWRQASYPDDLKFVSEAVIAFAHGSGGDCSAVLTLARDIICSYDTRCALALQPTIASYFLASWVHLPPHLRRRDWDKLLTSVARHFPLIQGDLPKYRSEEQDFTRRMDARAWPLGLRLARDELDLDEFVRNPASLTRDQIYAFTHRFFYMTCYARKPYAGRTRHVREFIEVQAFSAYVEADMDVLLECLLCYLALDDRSGEMILLMSCLLAKLLARDAERSKVLTDPAGFDFRAYYHQAFLFFMIAGHSGFRPAQSRSLPELYRASRRKYRFVKSLRDLDIAAVFRRYVSDIRDADSGYYAFLLKRFALSVRLSGILEADTGRPQGIVETAVSPAPSAEHCTARPASPTSRPPGEHPAPL